MEKQLFFKLESPDLKDQYRSEVKRKRHTLNLPKKEFFKSLWPGNGLRWSTAVTIARYEASIKAPDVIDINCGSFKLTAYYK